MKHTILAFAFFIGWISIYFSQDEATKIGFGCSKSESPSQLVNKIGDLILANKLEEVSAMLTSENASENYIAVVCIEKLVKAGHYTPSKDDSLNISKIHLSNRLIPTCSGCTKADEVTMDKLIKKNYAHGWLDEIIKKYEISGTYLHTVMDNFASGHHEIKLEILSNGTFKDRNGEGVWELTRDHLVLKYDHLPIDDVSGHEKYIVTKIENGNTTLTLDEKYSNVRYERISH
ncbi:MAG: hypothetical protein HRT71_02245 [Flavobacteriales bacterium]|nr:hypothetical protein [Flavobacteriales bacterium]